MVKISFRTALQGNTRPNVCFVLLFKCFVVVDVMLFCIVTFNLWSHYNKLLTYLLTYTSPPSTQRSPQNYVLSFCHSSATSILYTVTFSSISMSLNNENLAIANRSCVSCTHNMLMASIGLNITP